MSDEDQLTLKDLEIGINVMWITLSTYLVFLMQLGFTFLEAGSIRLKNLQTLLFKNCADICVNTISWWFIGYGIAFCQDLGGFMGTHCYIANGYVNFRGDYLNFLFQWAFAGTSAAIVSGCVAERMPVLGGLFYSVFSIAWVYPIVVHWTWGGGWLGSMGFHDFAGASTVHLAGGTAGFIATFIIGPRIGRFQSGSIDDFKPNNITYSVLGTLILWFSWYGFNCGQTLTSLGDTGFLIPLIGVNTTLSAVSGGLSSVLCYKISSQNINQNNDIIITALRFCTTVLCNGLLAGLVSSCAGCEIFDPVHSIILGCLAGIVQNRVSKLLVCLKIDDPLEAVSIHGGCGILGTLAVGFLDKQEGVFYHGDGKLLAIQCCGIVSIIVWVIICELPFLYMLKKSKLLRVSSEIELLGLDSQYFVGRAYAYDNITMKAYNLLVTIEGYFEISNRYKLNQINQIDKQRNIKGIKKEPRVQALFHANKLYNMINHQSN